jgi:hypothetical protein
VADPLTTQDSRHLAGHEDTAAQLRPALISSSLTGDDRSVAEDPIPLDRDVTRAAEAVREYGLGGGRTWYAGLRVDHLRKGMTVYRVAHDGFDEHVRSLVSPEVGLDVVDAAHTRDELEAMRAQVWELRQPLRIELISVPAEGDTLRVVVDGSAAKTQREFDRRWPGLTRVTRGKIHPV